MQTTKFLDQVTQWGIQIILLKNIMLVKIFAFLTWQKFVFCVINFFDNFEFAAEIFLSNQVWDKHNLIFGSFNLFLNMKLSLYSSDVRITFLCYRINSCLSFINPSVSSKSLLCKFSMDKCGNFYRALDGFGFLLDIFVFRLPFRATKSHAVLIKVLIDPQ